MNGSNDYLGKDSEKNITIFKKNLTYFHIFFKLVTVQMIILKKITPILIIQVGRRFLCRAASSASEQAREGVRQVERQKP